VDVGQKYKEHIFVNAMDKIVKWHSFWDPLVLLNPLRILIQWHCGRVVDSWLRKELEQRYDELRKESQGKPSLKFEKHRPRSVMDLAIKAYTEGKDANDIQKLDAQFVHMACHQIRLFLFAGNDSTSSTIVFAYHLLFKHPVALAKIQKEHDEVFGQDPAQAAIMLKEKPSLLHKCKYTLAVAKETLRLYPPAATMRMGLPGTSLATQRGVSFPIDHLTVLITHHALHHNERVWPRADEFVPERWLVDAEHELYPQSSAWRAFEVGPRNCIGQNLSINEIKVTLVMTIRSFVISPAYYELDEMQASQNVLLGWLPQWTYRSPRPEKTYKGDRAFPTEKAGAHPSEGYPCRVDLRR
jgi:cytochrome P450